MLKHSEVNEHFTTKVKGCNNAFFVLFLPFDDKQSTKRMMVFIQQMAAEKIYIYIYFIKAQKEN